MLHLLYYITSPVSCILSHVSCLLPPPPYPSNRDGQTWTFSRICVFAHLTRRHFAWLDGRKRDSDEKDPNAKDATCHGHERLRILKCKASAKNKNLPALFTCSSPHCTRNIRLHFWIADDQPRVLYMCVFVGGGERVSTTLYCPHPHTLGSLGVTANWVHMKRGVLKMNIKNHNFLLLFMLKLQSQILIFIFL